MKEESLKRDYFLDLVKAFAILFILLYHFKFIKNEYIIWAIPAFVFTTAALYQERWKSISLKKIIPKILWISIIVLLFTFIFYLLKLPKLENTVLEPTMKSFFVYFFLRNPYFAELWYLLLYFQILALLLLFYLTFKNKKFEFSKWYFGLIAFLIAQGVSYFLLFSFGKGLSFNVLSWSFLIWLGVFNYNRIKQFFQNKKTITLLLVIAAGVLVNFLIVHLGSDSLIQFLGKHTHDFIFPTIVLQLSYLIILFSLITLLLRINYKKIIMPVILLGQFSLYVYIFHSYIYRILFLPYFDAVVAFILTIVFCLIIGYLLERIRGKLIK